MARTAVPSERFLRFVKGRQRLLLSIAAGAMAFIALPAEMRLNTQLLISWDVVAILYVGTTFRMIWVSNVDTCRHHAKFNDEGGGIILLIVVTSASASFAAIFLELATVKSQGKGMVECLAVAGVTVTLSWIFTHLTFALHYASVYYKPDDDGPGGLRFPGGRMPDYSDFLYYSFVIGCATQTADVVTSSRSMRIISLSQGVVAFIFNSAIVALMINVGSGLA